MRERRGEKILEGGRVPWERFYGHARGFKGGVKSAWREKNIGEMNNF